VRYFGTAFSKDYHGHWCYGFLDVNEEISKEDGNQWEDFEECCTSGDNEEL